jgi:DNA (cytosine-5)-methyltransferase 1
MPRLLAPTLGPLDDLTDDQVAARFRRMIAEEEWGTAPAIGDAAFSALVAEAYARPRMFSYVDLFCGAGGSSIGLTMAGGHLLLAANHSKRAIETHSANFRNADHECADLNHYDMRKLPRGADVLWASPICTEISPAGGNKRQKAEAPGQLELMKHGHVPKDVFERTRATFHDVIRAAEVHRFRYVIVENVIEAARDWALFGWWLDGMSLLNYPRPQIVCVSSAHVGGQDNPHAPQRRDRMYVVFTRADCVKPDVDPRPMSLCDNCGPVEGVQWWKQPDGVPTMSGRRLRVGKYGARNQYLYRCPNGGRCQHSIVTPLERPAASVIDWSNLGELVSVKQASTEPLKPNTLNRIQRGLWLYGRPIHATVRGNTFERPGYTRAWPADLTPFMARTQTEADALAFPPDALVDTARRHATPKPTSEPFSTVSAGGNHHAVVRHSGLVVPYYTKGKAYPTDRAFGTTTVKDRFGVVPAMGGDGASLDVMDAFYRTVGPAEQARIQRFPVCYEITGNRGERTAQAGNAVSCNVAQWLGEAIAEALNRTAAAV